MVFRNYLSLSRSHSLRIVGRLRPHGRPVRPPRSRERLLRCGFFEGEVGAVLGQREDAARQQHPIPPCAAAGPGRGDEPARGGPPTDSRRRLQQRKLGYVCTYLWHCLAASNAIMVGRQQDCGISEERAQASHRGLWWVRLARSCPSQVKDDCATWNGYSYFNNRFFPFRLCRPNDSCRHPSRIHPHGAPAPALLEPLRPGRLVPRPADGADGLRSGLPPSQDLGGNHGGQERCRGHGR